MNLQRIDCNRDRSKGIEREGDGRYSGNKKGRLRGLFNR